MFSAQSVKTIVFISPDDAAGILFMIFIIFIISKSPELESSRAAPTLGSARAGGHDDSS